MIKFSEYFQNWAHDSYYKKGVKIGKGGDFYTSVSVGYLFGVAISNYFINLVSKSELSKNCAVVEIGANDGSMMADFIQGIYTLKPELLGSVKFIIIEPHESLREIQNTTFKDRFGDDIKVEILPSLEAIKIDEAFVMSNELFDSFACELINGKNMAFMQNNKLIWQEMSGDIRSFAKLAKVHKGELCMEYMSFATELKRAIKSGRVISFDYGQRAPRGDFSLRVYRLHEVFGFFDIADYGEFFGRSDITYDVCFEFLSFCFKELGFKELDFKTQANALLDECKIEQIMAVLQKHASDEVIKNAFKQLKYLLTPAFLGERFKFIEFAI